MNIAICDDNIYMTTKLEEIIASCFREDQSLFSSEVFLSGEELLKTLEEEPLKFQIYILDVEMKAINGLQTAARIREQDQNAIIIFVTSHDELMPQAFEVTAFHYLVKPLDEEKARQVFLRAIAALEAKKTLFQFVVRKKTYTLYLDQIEYFESYGRKVIIHTVDQEEFEYYGTLKEILEKVPGQLFVRIHNSYIVNMGAVNGADGEGVALNSGTEIVITKKYYKEFQAAYRNFVLTQANG